MKEEIVLMSISKDELQTLIIDSVNACLKFYRPKPEGNSLLELLTRKEAAEFLRCSVGTIDNFSRDGKIRKYYIGDTVVFKKDEIINALKPR